MNQLVAINNGQPVTTSLAVADGTENEHASIIKLVRTYVEDLREFGGVRFEIAPFETAGGTQKREVALLNEQQSTLLMTYMRNTEIVRGFKKRLVKAFFDLARQAVKPAIDPMQVLSDPAAMRGLLLNYTEKVIELESKVQEQTPKVEGFNRMSLAEGMLNLTNSAKTLNVQPQKLIKWLAENKWIYRRAGGKGWVAYQDRIQQGVLAHKIYQMMLDDGATKVNEQVLVTAKGLAKLSVQVPDARQISTITEASYQMPLQ